MTFKMKGFGYPGKSPLKQSGADLLAKSQARLNNQEYEKRNNEQAKADNAPNLKKSALLQRKRRKDVKVKNTDGITRVKPIKNVGKDGRVQTQQIKYADGSSHYNRYEDGEMVDQLYTPKKMRKKKPKKLKVNKRHPRPKKVKAPEYNPPEVKLDAETQKIYDARKRAEQRKKDRTVVDKVKKRPKTRKVKNLVTGKTNTIR